MLNTLVMTDNVRATIELHVHNKEWALNIIDDQKELEQHQIESIEHAVMHAFRYMFQPIALQTQCITYDVVTFHDRDCTYSFDFRLRIVDVHLR